MIWQSKENDKWYINKNNVNTQFDTQGEAKMAEQKLELARAIIGQVQLLSGPMDSSPDVVQEYFDSGITFVDDDVAVLGITAAQVVACLTLLENLNKFFIGGSPANAQYRVSVNAVRRAK